MKAAWSKISPEGLENLYKSVPSRFQVILFKQNVAMPLRQAE